ncbi:MULTISPECIES: ABC transporter permease [Pandoraea]|uniref:Putative aliphatic sulfonates transport systempermease n=1 Tax=Pandoraea communis TaxID=2508297 RepID=A0A5E4R9Q9_9BURK|nr:MULTISPECIES: ABC transporter permease [Pandoraea]VVD59563.1 putative aliphatic sulfonates transport systempermease [Pandoraea communis]
MNARARMLEGAMPWCFVTGILVIWEITCRLFSIPTFLLPSPSAVAASIAKWSGPILENAGFTLLSTLIGFALAVAAGLVIGVAIGSSRLIYRGLFPVLVAFNSVPKVAVVPVFVIWFGAGTIPAVLTAFMVSFFPIAVNMATGLATVEPELLDVLRALGATRRDILAKVGMPRSMPYFFASLKVAITLAFVGTIISETVASRHGIGFLMMSATSNFDTPLVFGGLAVTSVMGVVLYALFALIERRTTFWSQRDGGLLSAT